MELQIGIEIIIELLPLCLDVEYVVIGGYKVLYNPNMNSGEYEVISSNGTDYVSFTNATDAMEYIYGLN